MTTIFLVRHAHAHWNTDDHRPLSEGGYEAARALGERLALEPITAIYSSPHRRVVETVAPLAGELGLAPQLIEDLRERELPPVEADEFERVVEETWRTPDRSVRGSEPNAVAQARGVAVLRDLIARHEDEEIVVATHGTLLALILNGFDQQYGHDFWQTFSFPEVCRIACNRDVIV
jgi:2,3-bisphosphoglycerate-dependent phosphoglycerate mutase